MTSTYYGNRMGIRLVRASDYMTLIKVIMYAMILVLSLLFIGRFFF